MRNNDKSLNLYFNLKIKMKVSCDKDNYDPNGCTGPAIFNIEVQEKI